MTKKENYFRFSPCPKCHSDKIKLVTEAPECWVECQTCGASTGMYSFEDNAIRAWKNGKVTS